MPAATIDTIDTLTLRIPLDIWAPPPQFAGRPRTHVEMLLVRVATSDGVVGWGESYGSSSPMIPAVFDILDQAPRHRPGPDRPGPDGADRAPAAWLRPLRPDHPRDQRARHRAVGHPRQARRRLGLDAARRGQAQARRDLCLAAAIRRLGRAREAQHRARARARLSPHQAARTHRRERSRRRAMWPGPISRSWSTPTAPGRRPRRRAGRRHGAVEAVLGRGADLAAGGFRLARRAAQGDRRAAGDGRERDRRARFPQDGRRRRHRFRAAEHRQDRRPHQSLADCDRGREGRRHLRAARVLLRAGLSRDPACIAAKEREAPLERLFADVGFTRLCQDRAG